MITLGAYLALLSQRAEFLAPLVAGGMLLGDLFARGLFAGLVERGQGLVERFGRLDKQKRGVARLVYRGIIAVLMLLVPTLAISLAISLQPWHLIAEAPFFFLWFGHCFALWRGVAFAASTKKNQPPLELPGLAYLFADGHAVLRYVIVTRLEAFAIGILGSCFWYVVGGLPAASSYLVLASASRIYRSKLAFGWAARGLFQLMDLIPRQLSRVLFFVAALFTPGTRTFQLLRIRPWRVAVANLLALSLGGPSPRGEEAWAGTGTARLTYAHLRRALLLIITAGIVLSLLLATHESIKLLDLLK